MTHQQFTESENKQLCMMNEAMPGPQIQGGVDHQMTHSYPTHNGMAMPNQPMMMPNQPMMIPNQPMMIPNQPMMMQNQPMMQGGMMMMPISKLIFINPSSDPNFFGGMRCFYVNDPLTELANAKKASIKQRFEPWEALTGCETANQYYVFVKDREGNEKYLFKAKEESSWCCRNCVSGSAREFILHLRTIQNVNGKEKKVDFADFERKFKCTCCCLARPELKGTIKGDTSGGNVGKIVQACTVCNPKIMIFNRAGLPAWHITCDCCQCGYMCANTFLGKCSEVNFEVYQGILGRSGLAPGSIKKKFKGLKSILGDADFFDLTFPEMATPEERLLLITAVIMLDYLYYEDKDSHNSPMGMLNYL